MQNVIDTHEIATSPLDVAPAGIGGDAAALHEVPFHVSAAFVESEDPVVVESPTATQADGDVHETLAN